MEEVRTFSRAVAQEIRRAGWNPTVENGATSVALVIQRCKASRDFEPDPDIQWEDNPADVARSIIDEAYEKAFISAVEDKRDRLVKVMWEWTPAGRGNRIEQAIREAIGKTLNLYPQLATPDDPEDDDYTSEDYVNDMVEDVWHGIDQAVSAVEVLLNHAVVEDCPHAIDYMRAEIKHEVTRRLIGELARDLEKMASAAPLPGIPNNPRT
jgi:hypothetical protein